MLKTKCTCALTTANALNSTEMLAESGPERLSSPDWITRCCRQCSVKISLTVVVRTLTCKFNPCDPEVAPLSIRFFMSLRTEKCIVLKHTNFNYRCLSTYVYLGHPLASSARSSSLTCPRYSDIREVGRLINIED